MTINIKMWRAYIIYHNSKKLQSVQNNKVIMQLLYDSFITCIHVYTCLEKHHSLQEFQIPEVYHVL